MVSGAAIACLISFIAVQNNAIGLGIVAASLAYAFPTPVFKLSMLWVLLCRPGLEVFQASIGPVNVTEVDLLPIVATFAALRVRTSESEQPTLSLASWTLILAWPAWFLIRFALPQADGAVLFGSVGVDFRSISMYLALIPLAIYIHRKGWLAGLKLLALGAYSACTIAIAAWALLATGLVAPGRATFVYFLALNDVRPGGELMIAVIAVLLLLGQAPLALGSRALSIFLIFTELLVSQTLSIVVAIAAGFMVTSLLRWRTLALGSKALSITAVLIFVVVAVGGVAEGSRFNLASRIGGDSAQYRVGELKVVVDALDESVLQSAIGAGAGSLIAVENLYTHQIEIKRDTHNVYASVALKTGIVGVVLFLLPAMVLVRRMVRTKSELGRALVGSLTTVLVLSATVPFIWTPNGFAGLALLYLVAFSWTPRFSTHTSQGREIRH